MWLAGTAVAFPAESKLAQNRATTADEGFTERQFVGALHAQCLYGSSGEQMLYSKCSQKNGYDRGAPTDCRQPTNGFIGMILFIKDASSGKTDRCGSHQADKTMPMNMGYCRFSNTLEALRECADALEDLDFEELSVEEQQASEQLIELCGEIADKFVYQLGTSAESAGVTM